MIRSAPSDVRTRAEELVQKYLSPHAADAFKEKLHWLVVDAILADRKENPRLTSEADASPTESILHPLADRGKSADLGSIRDHESTEEAMWRATVLKDHGHHFLAASERLELEAYARAAERGEHTGTDGI
jgi:hypothetical protein